MFAAVAAMALVACSKVDEGVNVSTGKYTITATIGDAQTRTSYVDETADPAKGLKVEWEANETISVVEVTAGGTYNNKYWTFTSDNVAGAKATFTAPAGFETTEGCKYVAIYPALIDGTNGPYVGAAPNVYTALLRENTGYIEFFYTGHDNFCQKGANSMDLLKSYDLMTSVIEFNEGKADVNLTKLNSVIKFDLTLPAEAAGSKIYNMTVESGSNWWPANGAASISNIIDAKYWWNSVSSRVKPAVMKLQNTEGTDYLTVPNDCKISVYLPCPGNKSGQFSMATRFLSGNTYTISVYEKGGDVYSASKPVGETTIYIEQGTVNVIKATLKKE